jgi:hypothetical protein
MRPPQPRQPTPSEVRRLRGVAQHQHSDRRTPTANDHQSPPSLSRQRGITRPDSQRPPKSTLSLPSTRRHCSLRSVIVGSGHSLEDAQQSRRATATRLGPLHDSEWLPWPAQRGHLLSVPGAAQPCAQDDSERPVGAGAVPPNLVPNAVVRAGIRCPRDRASHARKRTISPALPPRRPRTEPRGHAHELPPCGDPTRQRCWR